MARKRRARDHKPRRMEYRGGYTTNKKADTSRLNFPSRPATEPPPRRPKNKSKAK